MILGCHVSFSENGLYGSARSAHEYLANAFMFYTGAPQNTIRKSLKEEDILNAQEFMKTHQISLEHVICHAPYIINLANKTNLDKWNFGITFLRQEILRCLKMGVKKMVLHPGSALALSRFEALDNIVEALNQVMDGLDFTLLLETMAGKGSECGCTLEEVKYILDSVLEKNKFQVCIDTCHLNDAGYDLNDFDSFLDLFDQLIGISKIGCVHLNDSKNVLASHKDRHENLGFGTISFETLLKICYHEKLKEVPKILETPFVGDYDNDKKRIYPPYRFEIEMIQKRQFYPDLYIKIREYYKNA